MISYFAMLISHATAQGSRSEQQDRYVIEKLDTGQLLAVMDGHGGARTAEILATHLAAIFQLAYKATPDDPRQALQETVKRLAQRTAIEPSGSTLSIVFIPAKPKTAFVAILGDSPVLILNARRSLQLSPTHNARSNLKERAAAETRGARYVEGYLEDPQVPGQGLQMSRALGDRALARILNRTPDLYSETLGDSSFVLLGTDGVLDGSDTPLETQLKRLADLAQNGYDAQKIVGDALKRQTGDNVTVVLWKAVG